MLVKSAEYFTDSAEKIGLSLGLPAFIVGVTIVAFGTSLPELIASILSVLRGSSEIVVGNVVGSNIFNTFGVMSIPAFFGVLKIPESILGFGLPVMLMATLLYFFITQDRSITRWEGYVLLLFYLLFIGNLFGMV